MQKCQIYRTILFILLLFAFSNIGFAQNTITDYCFGESLINTDARQRAFGEIGVVAEENTPWAGLKQNPALMHYTSKVFGLMFSRQPILGSGILFKNHFSINAMLNFWKRSCVGYSFSRFDKYSNLHSLKYRFGVSKKINVGVGLNYILNNQLIIPDYYFMTIDSTAKMDGIMFDIGGKFNDSLKLFNNKKLFYSIGFSVLNMGSKVKFPENIEILYKPANLNFGVLFSYSEKISNNLNITFNLAYQVQKLLVPTDPIYYDQNEIMLNGDTAKIPGYYIKKGHDPDSYSASGAMLHSFNDAPGGFKEEMQEIMHMVGSELKFSNTKFSFTLRYGRFMESKNKGGRNYNTMGVGIRFFNVIIDLYHNDFLHDNPRLSQKRMFIKSGVNIGVLFKM